jgi:hypothetical protein
MYSAVLALAYFHISKSRQIRTLADGPIHVGIFCYG